MSHLFLSDKEVATKIDSFNRNFNELKAANPDQSHLLEFLKLDNVKKRIFVNVASDFEPDSILSIIKLLLDLDFERIYTFEMEFSDDVRIEESVIKSILGFLSCLKNLCQLRIVQNIYKVEDWNSILLSHFFQFEPNVSIQTFSFVLFVQTEEQISFKTLFQQEKLYQTIQIGQQFGIGGKNEEMNLFLEAFKRINSLQSSFQSSIIQQTCLKLSKKKVVIRIMKNVNALRIEIALELVKFFEFEYDRISSVEIQIKNYHEYFQNSEIQNANFSAFLQLKLISKMKLLIEKFNVEYQHIIILLFPHIKGVDLYFKPEQPYHLLLEYLHRMKLIIKEGGVIPNLKVLKVENVDQDIFDLLFSSIDLFPNLNQAQILRYRKVITNSYQNYETIFKTHILRLKYLQINETLQLIKNKLFITLMTSPTQIFELAQILPKSMSVLRKSIHLNFEIYTFNDTDDKEVLFRKNAQIFYDCVKQFIGVPAVTKFRFKCDNFFPDINEVLEQRNQLYNLCSLFNLLIAPFMVFNPKFILLDLIDN